MFKNPPKLEENQNIEYKFSYYEYKDKDDGQQVWKVQAIYDVSDSIFIVWYSQWNAEDGDEMTLKAGDVLKVQYEDEGGW